MILPLSALYYPLRSSVVLIIRRKHGRFSFLHSGEVSVGSKLRKNIINSCLLCYISALISQYNFVSYIR